MLAAQTPGVYYAYQHSDSVGKSIVVFLVLVGSVVTWTVMIDKTLQLYRAKRLSARFSALFHKYGEENMLSMQLIKEAQNNSGPVASIYSAGMGKLLEFYDAEAEKNGTVSPRGIPKVCKLSDAQYNAVEAVLEREISSQLKDLETRIGLLATMVSLSPFCGLFGTVWGVMMAFCGVAAAGKPDFMALAPGVAGALLTTVAGLIVAIPALIGYNWLSGLIRQLTVQMDNFTEEFLVAVKLAQVKVEAKAGNLSERE